MAAVMETRAACGLCVAACALFACSESAEPAKSLRDAGTRDAAIGRDAAVSGAPNDAGGVDAAIPRDASVDSAILDAAVDSGKASCKKELMPKWPDFDVGAVARATRVPLDLLCAHHCPDTLAEFSKNLSCGAYSADELDAGNLDCMYNAFIKREGCGSVQFDSVPCRWPRHYNFDADSGKLIGAASLDDVSVMLQGTSCIDAGFVAGTLKSDCAEDKLSLCLQ